MAQTPQGRLRNFIAGFGAPARFLYGSENDESLRDRAWLETRSITGLPIHRQPTHQSAKTGWFANFSISWRLRLDAQP